VLYVVGADAVTRAVARGRFPRLLIVVVVVVAVVVMLLVRTARKRLAEKEEQTKGAEHDTGEKRAP
jgi:membrane protein implicated in regulation of membrane protease activity